MSRIAIRKLTLTLGVIAAILSVLGLVTQILSPGESDLYTWTHVFDLDAEATLPAWYQTALLLASGALLWAIGNANEPDGRFSRYWKFLAGVFVYISADENASLHETMGFWLSSHLGHKMGVYAWLIPGIGFVIYLAFASWKFLRHLPPAVRRGMLIAAIVYLAGAAGVEMIEAVLDRLWGTLEFSLLTIVEETFEMAGLVILIHTLLSHIRTLPRAPSLVVDP